MIWRAALEIGAKPAKHKDLRHPVLRPPNDGGFFSQHGGLGTKGSPGVPAGRRTERQRPAREQTTTPPAKENSITLELPDRSPCARARSEFEASFCPSSFAPEPIKMTFYAEHNRGTYIILWTFHILDVQDGLGPVREILCRCRSGAWNRSIDRVRRRQRFQPG